MYFEVCVPQSRQLLWLAWTCPPARRLKLAFVLVPIHKRHQQLLFFSLSSSAASLPDPDEKAPVGKGRVYKGTFFVD